jgi:hypothetical protein
MPQHVTHQIREFRSVFVRPVLDVQVVDVFEIRREILRVTPFTLGLNNPLDMLAYHLSTHKKISNSVIQT